MKISAIDIRKHTFEKIFRGYDPDEVDAFLNSLSQEWERFSSENNLLKMQLEYAEKELSKLKDIESTLFRTLKTAEDASKQIEKEANENAERRIQEAEKAANELVAEAENRTSQVIRETEDKLEQFKKDFASEVKLQERDFRAIENFRDNLIVQLASLANSTIETVERFEQKYDKESVLNKMDEIKQHISIIEIPNKPVAHEDTLPESAEEEINIVLDDEKPEVLFEIPAEEEIDEQVKEPEAIPEPVAVVQEPIIEEVKEPVRSAADEANEALAELQKTNEKNREEAAPLNRPRVHESSQSRGGGGSFFDQI
ncbi:cell division protein DivIVA [Dyadobacter luteus]|uniref:Cell division protein DivIVA n=1 Tax=Dyadobacter luteus TaxID=2259619 RepID=A0A3D8YB48_9BACT|nr:DivIVA domain-containing protein [Dyadobacter luteus]REA61254.1 cell division protein DivIVA [Dyadobacter luteus]